MKYITTATDKLEGLGGGRQTVWTMLPLLKGHGCSTMTLQLKRRCSEDKVPIFLLEKARMSCLKVRTFLYIRCILRNKYLPARQMINQCFYRDVLKCFKTKTESQNISGLTSWLFITSEEIFGLKANHNSETPILFSRYCFLLTFLFIKL
jgi:hypothetical protein